MNTYVDQTLQHTTVFLRLGKAYNAATQAFEAMSGVSGPRWRLLFLIHHQPAITQKQLIRQIRVDPGSITRQLKALETDGLIARSDDPVDTRLTRVRLTTAGRAEVRRVLKLRRTFLDQMVRGIAPRHMDLCLQVLDQICANLGDHDVLPIGPERARASRRKSPEPATPAAD